MKTLIFGHKNPDTDSICACISYAYLKDKQNEAVEPRVLGEIGNEAKFALNYFDVQPPAFLDNVMIQASDLNYEKISPLTVTSSIFDAFKKMEEEKIHTLPIVDDNDTLIGIVSMRDIAASLIYASYGHADTTLASLAGTFREKSPKLIHNSKDVNDKRLIGNLEIFDSNSFKNGKINSDTIVILKPNYKEEFFEKLNSRIGMLILSEFDELSDKEMDVLEKFDVITMSVSLPISGIVTGIMQSKSIETIMNKKGIITFTLSDYLSEIKDITLKTKFRNYPLITDNGEYIGLIGRRHLIRPGRKNVILVDHNEFHQSARGIEEANIVEVIDHHRIGGINTVEPIQYISKTVGSTCTIIYEMFKYSGIEIPYKIAGLMISGILSDTLHFKSPTCTQADIEAVNALNEILKLDLDKYTMDMFKEGSSIKGMSLEKVVNSDLKEFTIKGKKVAIAQVFTLDIDYIEKISEELSSYLEKLSHEKGYDTMLLAVTDIIKEGSYMYFYGNEAVIKSALKISGKQGDFVPYAVSRKKQILPSITIAMEDNA